MKTVGEAWDDISDMKNLPQSEQRWYELVQGSSKSVLYQEIERKYSNSR